MKLMDPFDQVHFDWRKKIGRYLAEKVLQKRLFQTLASILRNTDSIALPANPSDWIMEDLPAGYEMYDHNKEQGNGDIRHDIYMYGSSLYP